MRKTLGTALLALAITLSSQPADAADICFDLETAKRMVVDLEKCQIEREQIVHLGSANTALEERVSALEKALKGQDELLAAMEKKAEAYKGLADTTKQSYEELLEESKPKALEVILKSLGFVLVGVMVGMVL